MSTRLKKTWNVEGQIIRGEIFNIMPTSCHSDRSTSTTLKVVLADNKTPSIPNGTVIAVEVVQDEEVQS